MFFFFFFPSCISNLRRRIVVFQNCARKRKMRGNFRMNWRIFRRISSFYVTEEKLIALKNTGKEYKIHGCVILCITCAFFHGYIIFNCFDLEKKNHDFILFSTCLIINKRFKKRGKNLITKFFFLLRIDSINIRISISTNK